MLGLLNCVNSLEDFSFLKLQVVKFDYQIAFYKRQDLFYD